MPSQPRGDSRSLYHRWRSRSFSEVVAQEHVTRTLRNAVAGGRIVHAYLFCGPRGTGKTSTARILAKAVNCLDPQAGEPCNRCSSCTAVSEGRAIDLIEIDAASNRGIDDARELREKIRFSPAEARYKVYIIDEAHMLTSEASNALLKTLEEPPPHALLILATTEAHKILPTISSRCQKFDFRRIPLQAIVEQLGMICQREGVDLEGGVLDRVARMARGSLRDAESLLDQLVAYCGDHIGLLPAREVLGLTGEEAVPEFAQALRLGDLVAGFRLIDAAATAGADLRHFSRELVEYLRAMVVAKSGADTSLSREFRVEEMLRLKLAAEDWSYQQLLAAIRCFTELEGRMRLEPFNQVNLEVAFMEVALAESPREAPSEVAARPVSASSQPPIAGTSVAASQEGRGAPGGKTTEPARGAVEPGAGTPLSGDQPSSPAPRQGEEGSAEPIRLDLAGLRTYWPRILEELGAAAAVYRSCHPLEVSGSVVTFAVEKESLRSTIERPRLLGPVADRIGKLFGTRVNVKFRYGVKINREVGTSGRDAVVDAAVREMGFKILRTESVMSDE